MEEHVPSVRAQGVCWFLLVCVCVCVSMGLTSMSVFY